MSSDQFSSAVENQGLHVQSPKYFRDLECERWERFSDTCFFRRRQLLGDDPYCSASGLKCEMRLCQAKRQSEYKF